jgi:hypothetical protein
MRLLLSFIVACIGVAVSAQKPDVTYLESTGVNGNTRIFAVSTPVKTTEIVTVDGKAKLKPEDLACREVLNAILFDGVENYNDGAPLVANPNDAFARSLVNPKTKTFVSYFKDVQLENSPSNKEVYHYIVELNNFNLLRVLKMRGSID